MQVSRWVIATVFVAGLAYGFLLAWYIMTPEPSQPITTTEAARLDSSNTRNDRILLR